MATLSASTTIRESNGSLTLFKFKFTSVSTAGDTFLSGLGTSMTVGCWASSSSGVTASIDTSTSTVTANGCSVNENGGTFTIWVNKDGIPVDLYVWAKA